jgi:TM2 domain-containing membrane protein YozV
MPNNAVYRNNGDIDARRWIMLKSFKWLEQPKQQRVAVALALLGAIPGLPLAGLHKFYLRQPLWGGAYLLLSFTLIPHVASALEAVWYLWLPNPEFGARFSGGENSPSTESAESRSSAATENTVQKVSEIAQALRELEALRQEGLLSEYEFECQRRQLLDC